MGVYFYGNQLRIDTDGDDTESALLFGTLLMDPEYTRDLQAEYLGYDMHDERPEPLTTEDAMVVVDEVELIKRTLKNRQEPAEQYTVHVASDVAMGGVPVFLRAAGIVAHDAHDVPYYKLDVQA